MSLVVLWGWEGLNWLRVAQSCKEGHCPIWISKVSAAKQGLVFRALSLLKLYSLNYTRYTIFHFLTSVLNHIKKVFFLLSG